MPAARRPANGRSGLDPRRRNVSPRQSACAPGCCRSSAKVSEGSRRPSAVSGMPLPPPNRRHGVPCPARCISPVAAVFSRRGTSDAATRARGRVSPTDAGLLQARPASRTTGYSPVHGRSATVNAELLRRAQDALDFRVAPARPSYDGTKARRTIQASSAGHQLNFPGRARRHGGRASFSAPSLPDFCGNCERVASRVTSVRSLRSDGARVVVLRRERQPRVGASPAFSQPYRFRITVVCRDGFQARRGHAWP